MDSHQSDVCSVCGERFDAPLSEVYTTVRHRIKNLVNRLTLAELQTYGNNDLCKALTKEIDMMLNQWHMCEHHHSADDNVGNSKSKRHRGRRGK